MTASDTLARVNSFGSRGSFLAGAAALAALPSIAQAAPGAPVVVRAGTIPADVAAVVEYARDNGYFKQAGLDVEIQIMQSGPVIAPAVIGGSLDVGAANTGSLAGAVERGLPLRIFAPASQVGPNTSTDVIMVKDDSPIKTAADMSGKTVAIVAMKTVQHALFLAWIDKNGGDSKTIKMIEIPFPEMVGALDSGRVDVAIPSEPFTSQGRSGNRVIGNCYAALTSEMLLFGFFATEAWLTAHTDTALKFAAAIKQAAIWANSHQKASAILLTKFTNLAPAVADTMGRATYATTLEPAMIAPAIEYMVKYGFLPKTIDPTRLIWVPGK
jgi:NitT/TauT family transport system substrate-binding protein